jgi:hypothetical protein
MPTWVKITLVIVLVGFIGVAIAVIFAARWVKSQGTELQKQTHAVVVEAREFGRGKDGNACMAESLTRVRACGGLICETKVRMFLQNCLYAATVSPQVCAGIPKPTAIIDSAQWQVSECARRGAANDARCVRLIGELQVHCSK